MQSPNRIPPPNSLEKITIPQNAKPKKQVLHTTTKGSHRVSLLTLNYNNEVTVCCFFLCLEWVLIESVEDGREITLASVWEKNYDLLALVLWTCSNL